jgi:hypothetical protein
MILVAGQQPLTATQQLASTIMPLCLGLHGALGLQDLFIRRGGSSSIVDSAQLVTPCHADCIAACLGQVTLCHLTLSCTTCQSSTAVIILGAGCPRALTAAAAAAVANT